MLKSVVMAYHFIGPDGPTDRYNSFHHPIPNRLAVYVAKERRSPHFVYFLALLVTNSNWYVLSKERMNVARQTFPQ